MNIPLSFSQKTRLYYNWSGFSKCRNGKIEFLNYTALLCNVSLSLTGFFDRRAKTMATKGKIVIR